MPDPDDRSIGEVVSDIAGNVTEIVCAEVKLAQAALREDVAALKRGVVVLSIGALVGALAVGFALLAVVYALFDVVPPWVSAATVAGGAAVMALVFIMAGVKRMQHLGLPRTAATIQESVQWAKMRAR